MPGDEPDRQLAARLVAGDEAALREAYRTHAPAVLGLALRVIGNKPLAEEVMQDVFVRLWEHPDRFDPTRGKLRSYLLANTHSRAVERVRSEDARRRREDAAGREPVVRDDDPARGLQRDTVQDAVRDALAELPPEQRRAIELAYYEGLSYRDVAVALDEPEGTVKYRIRVGMQKMRAALRAVEVAPVNDDWDGEDRAIARALDAPDDGGPVDEDAVDEYREVLAQLPVDAAVVPPGLEDDVVAAALARRPAATVSIDATRTRRRHRGRVIIATAAGVAAALVVVVLVTGRDNSSPVPRGNVEAVTTQRPDVDALTTTAGARTGTFTNEQGEVVLAPSGQGDLYDLASRAALTIGLVNADGTSTFGPATARNGVISFRVDHPERVRAITLNANGNEIGRAALSAG